MKITLYRYEKDVLVMRSLDMDTLVNALRAENKTKPVANMRQSLKYTLMGKTNPLIERLPVLVFGATFRRSDGSVLMNHYNGCVLLEVNGLTGLSEAAEIRKQAAGMPQTLLAFVGAGGRSVKIVVPFSLPDGSLPRKEAQAKMFHASAYQLAIKHYQPQLDSMITFKEPVLLRGCRMSVDEEVYYNPKAVVITLEQPRQMPPDSSLRIVQEPPAGWKARLMPGLDLWAHYSTLFAVAMTESIRTYVKCGDNDLHGLFIDLAQKCSRGGIPEAEAVGWTLKYNDLSNYETDIRMTFRSAYELNKVVDKETIIPSCMSMIMQLEEFMERRYCLRMNVMSGEVEFLDRSVLQFVYRPYSLRERNSICMEAQKEGLPVWDKDIDRYVNSDMVPEFHPIDSFLNNLPAWNGKDHIRALADRVPCDDVSWRNRFYRWFLSMVAHWMELDREHGNSTTPLLVGDQGCGKSTFCLNILPPSLRHFYTDSIDFSKRQAAELALHRYALINIDEFDSVKASHQSFLKHVLQKAVVSTRMPYKSTIRSLRRYATFIGTSNNFDLLTDPTGSRRFICVEIKGVINYQQPIDYEQLYAQAKEALRKGERFWFTHQEEDAIVTDNQSFVKQPIEVQLFFQYFKPASQYETGKRLLASEILDLIKEKQKDFDRKNGMSNNLGRFLSRMEVPCRRLKNGTYYSVVEVND